MKISYAIRKYKVKRVAIDSITAVFQQYDAIYVVRREIFRLIARLKEIGVTTVMTTERVDDYGPIARYGVEEFVSDNVVLLRNVLESEKRRRTLEVLKLRGTVHMKRISIYHGNGWDCVCSGAMRLHRDPQILELALE